MMKTRCMGCMEEFEDQFDICPYCGYVKGTPAREAYHIIPGTVLHERYIIGKVLGFGGFGITYLGYDRLLNMKVAIKEYMPSEFSTRMPTQTVVTVYSGEKEEQFQAGLKNIIEEAKRLAKFQNEPDIVHVFDCFQENNTAYIIMEYLEGETLKERLQKAGKLPLEEAMPIVLTVLMALQKVHKEGIIHRDVAPDNIYLLNDGGVKLCDFGASRYATTKYSKSLSVIIKPGYAPEEQYRSRGDQGPWTDVYALAATFYKMLTGVTPEDAMERKAKDNVKRPSKMGVQIPKNIETAIMNAMNVKIADRTQSAMEFEQELLAAEVKEREVTKDKDPGLSVPKWILAGAGGIVAGMIVLAVLIGTGVIKMNTSFFNIESKINDGQVRVPNLINEYVDEAQTQCDEIGLQMRVADNKEYDKVIPADKILLQNPSNKEVQVMAKGGEIVVTICGGIEMITVPSVMDKNEEEAVRILEEKGFAVVIKRERSTKTPGAVIRQSLEENVRVEKDGAEIELVISLGEDGVDTTIEVKMIDIVGMDYDEALEQMGQLNLYLVKKEEFSDTVPEGQIIAQAERKGKTLHQGDKIEVVVSAGIEMVEVPDVEVKMSEDAIAELENAGLTYRIVQEYSSSYTKGQVISQDLKPTVGGKANMVAKGTEITLTVSLGRKPENTRNSNNTQSTSRQKADPPATTAAPPPADTRPLGSGNTPPATTAAPPPATTAAPPPATTAAPSPPEISVQAPVEGDSIDIDHLINTNPY
ncbi:MAG: PASTA domain-containing protein [Lachnospiraceae bacterium]|nr:PASTA domain-containing protein [Lachnospiraceae bacterium]